MNTVAAAANFHGLITSKTLIARVQAGDDVAWEDFYNTYKGFIAGVARKLKFSHNYRLSEEDIADLIHIVMLDLWKPGKLRFDPAQGKKFRVWFGTVIRNKLVDLNRKKTKCKPVDCSEPSEEDFPVEHFQEVWDAEYEKVIFAEAMRLLRADLAPATFKTFEMLIAGQSPQEIVAQLGGKENNVYQIKSRCVAQLNKIFEELRGNL